MRSESLAEAMSALGSSYRVGTLRTYISWTSLRCVGEAILVEGAIAVDMCKEVLGAVRRAAHAVGHLGQRKQADKPVECGLLTFSTKVAGWY